MQNKEPQTAVLLLEDGTTFYGKAVGNPGTATGEICFNTGMTGYQEIFTDPSYVGQIVVATHVHIGNYGVNHSETESGSIKISGLVCKNFSEQYSRIPAQGSLSDYFNQQSIPAISDIDTRAVVRYIRDKGAMNAIISSETTDLEVLRKRLEAVPSMEGLELSSRVSTKISYEAGDPTAKYRVALLDLGVKNNIIRCLTERDCFVKVFPSRASFHEMMEFSPDGFMLSNGPGDPAAMDYAIDTVKEILNSGIPMFGICLGHQIFAKAMGIGTYKMFNGHRGINHPIKNLITGLCEITSQNHGFAIKAEEVVQHPDLDVTHIHLNDQTIAGIRHKNGQAFSVQYHPEAAPGPHDSRYLFDSFTEMMSHSKKEVPSYS